MVDSSQRQDKEVKNFGFAPTCLKKNTHTKKKETGDPARQFSQKIKLQKIVLLALRSWESSASKTSWKNKYCGNIKKAATLHNIASVQSWMELLYHQPSVLTAEQIATLVREFRTGRHARIRHTVDSRFRGRVTKKHAGTQPVL